MSMKNLFKKKNTFIKRHTKPLFRFLWIFLRCFFSSKVINKLFVLFSKNEYHKLIEERTATPHSSCNSEGSVNNWKIYTITQPGIQQL